MMNFTLFIFDFDLALVLLKVSFDLFFANGATKLLRIDVDLDFGLLITPTELTNHGHSLSRHGTLRLQLG